MEDTLPFPLKMAFLLLILPLAFVYLVSVAGVALMCARRAMKRFISRLHPTTPIRPPGP